MKDRGTILLLLGIGFVIAGLTGGCGSPGDDTLAVVNDYEITVDEFYNFFPEDAYAFASAQEEFDFKSSVLDSVIISRMLVQAAYEKGMDKTEEMARVVLGSRDKFLLDVLYQREITAKSEPTEAEIRDFYNRMDTKIRLQHILVSNPDTAQMLFEKLADGESFEKLAYEYSVFPTAKKDKGDLGYITWGMMIDEVQEVAFNMEAGELSPPIKSFMGYHIVEVSDRSANDARTSFEEMRDGLRTEITGLNSYRHIRALVEDLKIRYPIRVETTTCDYLMHKREQMYPPQILATLPRSDFDMEQLDRNEKELIMASWDGGQITLQDYLTRLQSVPLFVRPDLDDYDSLAATIFLLVREEVMAMEARNRGFESDPEFISKLRLFKELNMAELMRSDSIPKSPDPDEAMIRQYYDDHPEQFTTAAKVHVYEILLRDEMKANQLKQKIKLIEEFKERAMELTERPGRRNTGGDLGTITDRFYPEIFAAAWETPVGSIGGPVVDDGKYSIFWVEDKIQPALKDYLGSKRSIHDQLVWENDQAAFAAWIEERRSSTSIEINDDAIWGTINMDLYQISDTDTTLAEG
jgi:parvulin-like peptidyl-prolyl isomerase